MGNSEWWPQLPWCPHSPESGIAAINPCPWAIYEISRRRSDPKGDQTFYLGSGCAGQLNSSPPVVSGLTLKSPDWLWSKYLHSLGSVFLTSSLTTLAQVMMHKHTKPIPTGGLWTCYAYCLNTLPLGLQVALCSKAVSCEKPSWITLSKPDPFSQLLSHSSTSNQFIFLMSVVSIYL